MMRLYEIVLDPPPGTRIDDAITEAMEFAYGISITNDVFLIFNGTKLKVNNKTREQIEKQWSTER